MMEKQQILLSIGSSFKGMFIGEVVPFTFEDFAKGMLQQAVWILVIVAVAVAVIGYVSQGVGSAIAKVAGAIAIIALLVALMKGKEIGEWLVDHILKLGMIYPMNPVLRGVSDGIRLFTRI
ncbi:hypothetical protein P003_02998 [Enterococcus faecalis EnGen0403]|uniref:hypothetical protein n=1 Tax=Enterococcus faecalis TaxID=1351 RepID=UPI000447AAC5|nr:hypothetical protein [Enterococcus faecalis]ETT95492.1 hypothetical protein P003_02998 [Enterococcus faecalis EnGen0403]ETU00523.1 hypothetical protein P004_03025 [Enterococcus faecalis EnGen0404]ETU01039.1 hypothetical protein P005_02978 [Enterococcus faecalis EnGen0405]ETU11983.1 hypothetical protein P008_03086 [Enterococcus faecalis EnGen0408]